MCNKNIVNNDIKGLKLEVHVVRQIRKVESVRKTQFGSGNLRAKGLDTTPVIETPVFSNKEHNTIGMVVEIPFIISTESKQQYNNPDNIVLDISHKSSLALKECKMENKYLPVNERELVLNEGDIGIIEENDWTIRGVTDAVGIFIKEKKFPIYILREMCRGDYYLITLKNAIEPVVLGKEVNIDGCNFLITEDKKNGNNSVLVTLVSNQILEENIKIANVDSDYRNTDQSETKKIQGTIFLGIGQVKKIKKSDWKSTGKNDASDMVTITTKGQENITLERGFVFGEGSQLTLISKTEGYIPVNIGELVKIDNSVFCITKEDKIEGLFFIKLVEIKEKNMESFTIEFTNIEDEKPFRLAKDGVLYGKFILQQDGSILFVYKNQEGVKTIFNLYFFMEHNVDSCVLESKFGEIHIKKDIKKYVVVVTPK